MIVKMIQNLEIKMESQINSLEKRIEKMQERFKKDLEDIKKSQYIMNNAVNEIKNTLDPWHVASSCIGRRILNHWTNQGSLRALETFESLPSS